VTCHQEIEPYEDKLSIGSFEYRLDYPVEGYNPWLEKLDILISQVPRERDCKFWVEVIEAPNGR
jgi:hypothetical protein